RRFGGFDVSSGAKEGDTARLRAGYLFGDGAVLTYVTGGLAYGRVGIDGTTAVTVPGFGSPSQAFGHSQVNTGWVVGTGTEGKLLIPGWTYKIEGLYMDLGHLDATGPGGSATVTIPATITTTSRAIQDWLGHRAIQHTARYTELSQERFKDFWRT